MWALFRFVHFEKVVEFLKLSFLIPKHNQQWVGNASSKRMTWAHKCLNLRPKLAWRHSSLHKQNKYVLRWGWNVFFFFKLNSSTQRRRCWLFLSPCVPWLTVTSLPLSFHLFSLFPLFSLFSLFPSSLHDLFCCLSSSSFLLPLLFSLHERRRRRR